MSFSSLIVLAGSCSSGTGGRDGAPSDGGETADATADAACTGPLEEVGAGCPATFDGSEAALPSCVGERAFFLYQSVWLCGDLIHLLGSNGTFAESCFYDSASHALVGAAVATDLNVHCDSRSFIQEAGRVDWMCSKNAPTFMRDCTQTTSARR